MIAHSLLVVKFPGGNQTYNFSEDDKDMTLDRFAQQAGLVGTQITCDDVPVDASEWKLRKVFSISMICSQVPSKGA